VQHSTSAGEPAAQLQDSEKQASPQPCQRQQQEEEEAGPSRKAQQQQPAAPMAAAASAKAAAGSDDDDDDLDIVSQGSGRDEEELNIVELPSTGKKKPENNWFTQVCARAHMHVCRVRVSVCGSVHWGLGMPPGMAAPGEQLAKLGPHHYANPAD
jgi:hypothetical protein